jgi:hypothetical protein
MIRLAALALACLAAFPALAEEGGSGKKSAFEPGEHLLQLPPLWVPVAGMRSRNPAVAVYRPITLRLTSRETGMMAMCYRLPYLTEAFLFELNRAPVRVGKDGRLDLGGVETRLLGEAARIAGAEAVKSVEAIDGIPPAPAKTNHDMLALCQ